MFYTILGVHSWNVWSDSGCDIDEGKLYKTIDRTRTRTEMEGRVMRGGKIRTA